MEAAFEFFYKVGTPYYCAHDRDIAPAGKSVTESEELVWKFAEKAKAYQERTGIKMWTAKEGARPLFSKHNMSYVSDVECTPSD